MHGKASLGRGLRCLVAAGAMALAGEVHAQQTSVSAWDAAKFRIWGYIPYWTTSAQISGFASNGLYSHVSDVLYFGGLRTDAGGNLAWYQTRYRTDFNTVRSQSQTLGFDLHLSMFEVTNGQTDVTWEALIASPTARTNFVNNLKATLEGSPGTADDLKGFNFDWERPSTGAEWGNYTQLARELRTAINPSGMEVSVCDYGYADTKWDDTAQFDAGVYDQLMIMGYHYDAASQVTFAATKKNLTQQGNSKAFKDSQLAIGVGTWGAGTSGETTAPLSAIVGANPNLAYDATTYQGTLSGTTGTWAIESRKQVREKTQFALDRNMPGMFTWAMNYDATNNLGLHRVMQHYAVVKRDVPDLNLDGKLDASDYTAMLNNLGTSLTHNLGFASAANFDKFYLGGNWEKGDHDGNGWVNQKDADWLAARFTNLGVTLPNKLAFTGKFESLINSRGLNGEWRVGRDAQNNLTETSNFKQETTGFLGWAGFGYGAARRSNSFVTIRNQNANETAGGVNSAARTLRADLTTPINLAGNENYFFTFLVKENTSGLSSAQLASSNRTLSLQFLNSAGVNQFDFTVSGSQQRLLIQSQADTAGQDVNTTGFTSNATYFVIGKIAPNGAGVNTLYASLFPSGSSIGEFTHDNFQWMLTAQGGAGFNPTISQLQFMTLAEGNFTVSNVWLGTASTIPEPASLGLVAIGGLTLRRRREV